MEMIRVGGNVSGRMLLGAMLRAQAAARGRLQEKQAAGVGIFRRYLDENSARREAWKNLSRLSPEVAIARASLAADNLQAAARLVELTTDADQRRALLGQIISPHLDVSVTIFGTPVGMGGNTPSASALTEGLTDVLQANLPRIGLELVGVPQGRFMMGSEEKRYCQGPVRQVTISGFRLGKYEVTNGQYGIFMQQTGHREPVFWGDEKLGKEKPTHPVVGVDYAIDALDFANWIGMRLPTEAEGEYAARGKNGLSYPWGDEWDALKVAFNKKGTVPVNAHPDGASPFGVEDLSGNVAEWRADWFEEMYDPEDLIDPKGPEQGTLKVVRGGLWNDDNDPEVALHNARRSGAYPRLHSRDVGFRVADDE